MTDNQIKEAMSREFLRILAFGHGFKVIEPATCHDGLVSLNDHQIRISVPKANRLRAAFVQERFAQLGIKL